MLNTTRLVAFIAALAFGSSVLLLAGPFRPDADVLPGAEAPSAAQALDNQVMEMVNANDRDLLLQLYADDATHTVVYADGPQVHEGVDEIAEPMLHPSTFSQIAPILELPTLDIPGKEGEVRWMSFLEMRYGQQVWPGIVCSFWAREGQIQRHDCLMPEVYADIEPE